MYYLTGNIYHHGTFIQPNAPTVDRVVGRFVHISQLDLARLSPHFHASMLRFFLERELINQQLARNMLQWDHSGFSLDGSVRIPAGSSRTREALAQYIARAPVSL